MNKATSWRKLRLKTLAMGINPNSIVADAGDPLISLQEQIAAAQRAAQTIQAQADAEGRPMTDEEEQQYQQALQTVAKITRQIESRAQLAELNARIAAPSGRRTASEVTAVNGERPRPTIAAMTVVASRDPRGGFVNFGEFLMAVRNGSGPQGHMDDRLRAALTEYGNETTPADGGYAVPPDFRTAIWQKITAEPSLLSRCDQIFTGTNNLTLPKDNLAPWDDSSGIKANWTGEAGAKPQSKPDLDQMTVRLHKLTVLVPMTDELLEDAPAMNSYVVRKAGEKIDFKVSMAIIQGTNVGQPQGIITSPGRVTVPRLSGQAANSLLFPNINAMYSRMPGEHRPGAIWLVHPMIDEMLPMMDFRQTSTAPASPIPVYLPANQISQSPFASLYGRPVIPSQVCNAPGTEGDILFVNLQQYLALLKTGGVRQDVSIHVYFENDVTAFRFVLRIGGTPWWTEPLASRVGTFNMSPYVTLGAPAA